MPQTDRLGPDETGQPTTDYQTMNDDYYDFCTELTDAQLFAHSQLMTQTHRLLGLIDEMCGHPALDEQQKQLLDDMYSLANEIDNRQHDRLAAAKRWRGIEEEDSVKDHIDLRRVD